MVISHGEGAYLYSDKGQKILDFATGIAVNSFGHGHPHLVEALKKQTETLWHCSNMYRMEGLERFASRLVEASFADSVFFCSSGAEAVESGLKFMRRYHYETGAPERTRVITFEGGFHGRTYGGISAGGNDYARVGFGPLLEGFDRVAFGDMDAFYAAITSETAGVLLEPIQGEGGVQAFAHDNLHAIRKACDEHGILLMCDEVQCGYGRPGTLFAFEQAEITPDIVSSAKGIGGGFPLGATLVTEAVGSALPVSCHGSTYGSNPLAMAAGNAVLDLIQKSETLPSVKVRGEELLQGLQELVAQHPETLASARGIGLMIGLVPQGDGRELGAKLLKAGLATAPSVSNVVRILPPLNVTKEQVDEGLEIIRSVLAA